MRGYWDASFASTANSYVLAGIAISAIVQTPELMTSQASLRARWHTSMRMRDTA